MGNIFKKVIAGALAAVMTVTSLSISAFAWPDENRWNWDHADVDVDGTLSDGTKVVFSNVKFTIGGTEYTAEKRSNENEFVVNINIPQSYKGDIVISGTYTVYEYTTSTDTQYSSDKDDWYLRYNGYTRVGDIETNNNSYRNEPDGDGWAYSWNNRYWYRYKYTKTTQTLVDTKTGPFTKTFTSDTFAQAAKDCPKNGLDFNISSTDVEEIIAPKYTLTTKYTLDGTPLTDKELTVELVKDSAYETKGLDAYSNTNAYALSIVGSESGTITADTTVTYNYTTKYYTVEFVGVSTKTDYKYGDTIIVPSAPEKSADKTYTYAFSKWTDANGNEPTATVVGNATYTAQYDKSYIEYIIKFYDENNNLLDNLTLTKHYNDTITAPAVPEKTVDDDKFVASSAWSPEFKTTVEDNANYTATYDVQPKATYTVKWIVDSATTTDTYYEGQTFNKAVDPTKTADLNYTYSFSHWNANGVEVTEFPETVTEDLVYTAVFNSEPINYTVNWVLDENTTPVNTASDVTYATATTEGYADTFDVAAYIVANMNDKTFTYTFNNDWAMSVEGTTITFKGTTTQTKNVYTVTTIYRYENLDGSYTDEDKGTVEYFNDVDYTTKGKNLDGNENKYQPAVMAAESSAANGTINGESLTVIYVYNRKTYTVAFKNGEDTVKSTILKYGAEIVVPTEKPTKTEDATYTYEFKGWTPTVAKTVTGDVTYVAEYNNIYKNYTIKFLDENNDEITGLTITDAHIGDKVVAPTVPAKTTEDESKYIVSSWTPVITDNTTVTGDMTFVASYTVNDKIVITWDFDNGTDNATEYYMPNAELKFPEDPTKPADNNNTYAFTGWSDNNGIADENKTITAQYTATERTYTINYVDYDGTALIPATTGSYTETPNYTGTTPTRADVAEGNTVTSYTFSNWNRTVNGDTITFTATYTSSRIIYGGTPTIEIPEETGSALAPTPDTTTTVVIPEESVPLIEIPEGAAGEDEASAETTKGNIEISEDETPLAANPGTGVGIGGIACGTALSMIVCAACVFSGKKKKNK